MVKHTLAQQRVLPYSKREMCVVEMDVCYKPVLDALNEICEHGYGNIELVVKDGKITAIYKKVTIKLDEN